MEKAQQNTLLGIEHRVWSVWFFFFGVGFLYSQFTSRMPALVSHVGMNEGEVGLLLMCFSLGSLTGLASSGLVLRYVQSKTMLRLCLLLFALGLFAITLVNNVTMLLASFVFWGLTCSFVDVCMNSQAIFLEHKTKRNYLGKMHANYSVGCVFGSMVASIFAFANLGINYNFTIVAIVTACCCLYFARNLMSDVVLEKSEQDLALEAERQAQEQFLIEQVKAKTNSNLAFLVRKQVLKITRLCKHLPFFIILCGLMGLLSYLAEGSVAEWGGLLMFNEKGADEGTAALSYGVLATVMAASRFMVDSLRLKMSDTKILLLGASIAILSLLIIIFTNSPYLCLVAYAFLGLGLAPITPIAISRAGSSGLVQPKTAATIVAITGYSGYLVLPPLIGYLAVWIGLEFAMFLPCFGIIVVAFCSYFFRQTHKLNS